MLKAFIREYLNDLICTASLVQNDTFSVMNNQQCTYIPYSDNSSGWVFVFDEALCLLQNTTG